MKELTITERELVALGAALGSNCVPCIEHHVPEARKAGLSDRRIKEAIRLADQIRRVPARKVLVAAFGMLSEGHREADAAPSGSDGARSAPDPETEQPCCA
jgi:4-carboxymuconolactone decarboxylase